LDVDDIRNRLLNIQVLDTGKRARTKLLEQHRRLLKEIQKSLRPQSKKGDSACAIVDITQAKEEMKRLKHSIQLLQDKLDDDSSELQRLLWAVPNVIDKDLDNDLRDAAPFKPSPPEGVRITDPVFCLGGYDKTQIEEGDTFITLSETVILLTRSLVSHALLFFKKKDFPVISPPEFVMTSKATAHSVLGCCQQDCSVCNESMQLRLPSYLAGFLFHREKVYWDRELPMGHITVTTNQCKLDEREANRLSTFKHTKRKWFEEVQSNQVGMLGFTICTMEETRRLQTEIADQIMAFHASLCPHNDTRLKSLKVSPILRKRAISPPDLLPHEVSRIVVEGFLNGIPVVLGFVSNFADYISRATRTRCGGAYTEYVYSFHATLCSDTETLEWMVHNNIMEVDGELGVGVISLLAKHMGWETNTTLFLPFQRRLEPGKAGRRYVVKELPASSPRIIDKGGEESRSKGSDDAKQRQSVPFALSRMPTKEEIKGEYYMNPFDFLPLE
jgi:hypothetical protein